MVNSISHLPDFFPILNNLTFALLDLQWVKLIFHIEELYIVKGGSSGQYVENVLKEGKTEKRERK